MVTDLIEAVWPYEENLAMSFKAAQGTGEEYLRTHFPGIEIEIIDLRNKNIKIPFSDLDRKQEE